MEVFAAIGLAAAVVQFVDFGSRITKDGIAAYKSISGLSEQNVRLNDISDELRDISKRLATGPRPGQTTTPDEWRLYRLAGDCQMIADELADLLSKLTISTTGAARTWNAVCKALKGMIKKKRLGEIREQLEQKRQQIHTVTLSILRDSNSRTNLAVNDLCAQMQQMHVNDAGKLQGCIEQVLAKLSDMKHASTNNNVLMDIAGRLRNLEASILQTDQSLSILKALDHMDLRRREHGITAAYGGTYDWLLPENNQDFRPDGKKPGMWPADWHGLDDWLQTGFGVYWITGKAGSGKSCLMKHLQESSRAQEMLAQWGAGTKVTTAHHYFWRAGSVLQKSKHGLLRWLLLQLLGQAPLLVKECFPDRWLWTASTQPALNTWTLEELSYALETALRRSSSHKFCIFIDGLDEFEENDTEGGHYKLVQYLSRLRCSENVKLCISSRPWIEFREAYSKQPHLALHDWTRRDISTFIYGMLNANTRFRHLAEKDSRAVDLIQSILGRADGVFLWVRLVITSLLRELNRLANLSVLTRLLDLLPKNLDKYFMHMLDSIEPVYQERAACLLLYVAVDDKEWPMPALLPAFIDRFYDHATVKVPCSNEDDEDFFCDEEMENLVDAWCPDLLEFDHTGRTGWSFAHRSIHDFILSPKILATLTERLQCDIDWPYFEAMAHVYALRRSLAGSDCHEYVSELGIHHVLGMAQAVGGAQSLDVLSQLTEELERRHGHPAVVLLCHHYQCNLQQLQVHLAIDYHLTEYLDSIYDGPWQQEHLRTACASFLSFPEKRVTDSHLVEHLLCNGLSPNANIPGQILSIWQQFLKDRTSDRSRSPTSELSTARVLLKYGAQIPLRFDFAANTLSDIIVDADEVIRKLEGDANNSSTADTYTAEESTGSP